MIVAAIHLLKNPFWFLVCLLLILWTKEEYIPVIPVIVAWLVATSYVLKQPFHFSPKYTSAILITYVLGSAISVSVLLYFRALNEVNPAVRSLRLDMILEAQSYVGASAYFIIVLLPFLPFCP